MVAKERMVFMNKIGTYELKQIKGGGISLGLGLLIGAGVVLVAGIIDGYFRPLKCN